MKKILVLMMLGAMQLAMSASASAETGQKPSQEKQAGQDFDKRMAQMREQLKQMQAQMEKIRQTQNPAERQKLLQEHWGSMQSGMGMMHGMWGPGMMGCCMGGGMMGGPMMWNDYRQLTPEQAKQRQYMMDQSMRMQQEMMQQMMEHQEYMWMR